MPFKQVFQMNLISMEVLELFHREWQKSKLLKLFTTNFPTWSTVVFQDSGYQSGLLSKVQNDFCLKQFFFPQCGQLSQFSLLHFASRELPAIQRPIHVDLRTNWDQQAGVDSSAFVCLS